MTGGPLPESEIILCQTEHGRTRIQCRFENEISQARTLRDTIHRSQETVARCEADAAKNGATIWTTSWSR